MKKILFAIIALAVLTACHKDKEEDPKPEEKAGRTVLVYMAAENNLGFDKWGASIYRYANDDLAEMKEGMKTIGNNHLVIYVDKPRDAASEDFNRPTPYMLHFHKGELKDSIQLEESLTSRQDIRTRALATWFRLAHQQRLGTIHRNGKKEGVRRRHRRQLIRRHGKIVAEHPLNGKGIVEITASGVYLL